MNIYIVYLNNCIIYQIEKKKHFYIITIKIHLNCVYFLTFIIIF